MGVCPCDTAATATAVSSRRLYKDTCSSTTSLGNERIKPNTQESSSNLLTHFIAQKVSSLGVATSATAGSANLCYSDDTLSPAIVLLLWCYSPLSLVFECYSSCAIATTPFCLVPDCFDLFHKVEILHLAQQGIAASLSECPWLTPTPVIKNHT